MGQLVNVCHNRMLPFAADGGENIENKGHKQNLHRNMIKDKQRKGSQVKQLLR